jgi:hypothetical protein
LDGIAVTAGYLVAGSVGLDLWLQLQQDLWRRDPVATGYLVPGSVVAGSVAAGSCGGSCGRINKEMC